MSRHRGGEIHGNRLHIDNKIILIIFIEVFRKFDEKKMFFFLEILKYLEYLAFRYPQLVELITIGHSFEGQPLKVVKVSSGPTKDGKAKPILWIDAGEKKN